MINEAVRLSPKSTHKVAGLKRSLKSKLCMENKLLMLLICRREYRIFLHINSDNGISEAQCWRIITDFERLLIKSEMFYLPEKKSITTS